MFKWRDRRREDAIKGGRLKNGWCGWVFRRMEGNGKMGERKKRRERGRNEGGKEGKKMGPER